MGADSRAVATDALATLGTIIGPDEKRDAIHLGVEPVVAGEPLQPGQHVGLVDGVAFIERLGVTPLGIVDPFLTKRVRKGQRFWLLLYPGQITSLRHVWTHPAFPDTADVAPVAPARSISLPESMQWLDDYADELDVSLNDLMQNATRYVERGDMWRGGAAFEGLRVPEEFWVHFGAVTGKYGSGSFFTCSC